VQPDPRAVTAQFAEAVRTGNGWTGTFEDAQGNPAPLTINAPQPATVGTNATAPPSAGPLSSGQAFPLKQTVISVGPTGTGPDTTVNQTGATLTFDSGDNFGPSELRLSIPALGVDYGITSSMLLKGQDALSIGSVNLITSSMNYAFYGLWETDTSVSIQGSFDAVKHIGAFVAGYQTPASAMPTSGTATYSGTNNVTGIVASYPYYGGIFVDGLKGDASFSANFATGTLSGNFTNMTINVKPINAPLFSAPWNDVSVSASIAQGTSTFSGTTTVTSTPPHGFSAGTTGLIQGSFYGPNAQELGAAWSLSDGATTAIGVVGAHQ
jgi:hypothetical protein